MFIGGGGREAVSGRRRPAPEALGPAARGRSRAQSRSVPSARTPALPWCSGRPAPRSRASAPRHVGTGAAQYTGGVPSFPVLILARARRSAVLGRLLPPSVRVDSLCWQQFSHALKRQTRSILLCGSIPVSPPARSRSMASR